MSAQPKIFVVVDPSDEKHVALERAIITSKFYNPAPKLYVYVGVDPESVDTRSSNDGLFRSNYWFEEEIVKPIKENNLEYVLEISWSSEWHKSILSSAKSFAADVILMPVHKKTNKLRFTFSDSKWTLLKKAHCPVIVVQPDGKDQRKVVLAAVNYQATKKNQLELNKKILELARLTAIGYEADFHVVNAFKNSMHYPDRGKLALETGLPGEKIHVVEGHSDEMISYVAKEVTADLVVMGTLNQDGKTKTIRGNSTSRAIAALDVDVIVLNVGVNTLVM